MFFLFFFCIAFISAILWVDIIFDLPAFPYRGKPGPLPEEVLVTMSSFYRRITARPVMIFVMAGTVLVVLVTELVQGLVAAWVSWLSLAIFVGTVVHAALRIIPTARRFGSRVDTLEKQTELAHALLPLHGFTFAMLVLTAAIQLFVLWGR